MRLFVSVFPKHILAPLAAALVAMPSAPARKLPPAVSAIQYDLTFNATTGRARSLVVTMRFEVSGAGTVALSLPAWTPGAYELSNFARKVSEFAATSGGHDLHWDKQDYDTWRVDPSAAGQVEVKFAFAADTLDNAMAWSKPDFLLVNGTNVFLYPEGMGLDFPASVTVTTEPNWIVTTGMHAAGPRRYDAKSYHDLVDMPFFIGRFDVDSNQIEGHWHRLASYPAGTLAGPSRKLLWGQLQGILPAESKVFGETPWENYSTMLIFDSSYGGGSALEHQSSHVGIYNPGFVGTPILASITAHEIFHAWNVKRLRPSEMVPYRYDVPEPTPLLWVSEGITDYYADLALVRPGIVDSSIFLNLTNGKIEEVGQVPPIALEDASVSTWIQPTDGTATIYYPKGSLAGFMIDILIRDASDNKKSLDDVFRALYSSAYKQGKGFTTEQWWAAVKAVAPQKNWDDFSAKYVDGRMPYPWAEVGPLMGLRQTADTVREPRIGISTAAADGMVLVTQVAPGSAADAAGVQVGDHVINVGGIEVTGPEFGQLFRAKYGSKPGTPFDIVVKRGDKDLTLSAKVVEDIRIVPRLEFDRRASLKAAQIRAGILHGVTSP
ncbi:MAG: PDZ domain-containing protein [Gemmatimonadota bacterium]